jgi:hypothetical protein
MHASRVKWAPLLLFCLTVAGGYLLASNAVPAEAITGPGSGRKLVPNYEWQAVAGSWRLCIGNHCAASRMHFVLSRSDARNPPERRRVVGK